MSDSTVRARFGVLPGQASHGERFALEARTNQIVVWFSMAGVLDVRTAAGFELTVNQLPFNKPWLIGDMRQLMSVDNVGLRSLVEIDTRARQTGRRLLLVHVPIEIGRQIQKRVPRERLRMVDLDALPGAPPRPSHRSELPGRVDEV